LNLPDIKPPPDPLPLTEVATLLIKRYGIHEGLWDLAFEMNVGIGLFGQSSSDILPGAMFRVSRVGLARAPQKGPLTVDAAEVNPTSEQGSRPASSAK
jgi:hypothetical protein